ncbi:MAG: 3'(2'),5'-bisphosphate nucleotidase CysQ [Thermaerobacter sp.]|nr:3'(2'),5'-bisphosphate nucleotidase CysQ [Thermaerobacter sp.]
MSYMHVLTDVMPAVRRARQAVLEIYREERPDVQYKSDQSPVTAADRAAHRILVDALRALTPDWPVVSEEGLCPAERLEAHRIWLVDPLDGTRDFLGKTGDFSINVALVEDGRAVAGLVDVPVSGATYLAELGRPVTKLVSGQEPLLLSRPRVRWSDPMVLAVSRNHRQSETEWAAQRGITVSKWIPAGAALKFCYLAEGRVDLYVRLGPTMEWDTAAGQVLVEAMGGTLRGVDGAPMRYNKVDLLNPAFYAVGPLAGEAPDWARETAR